MVKRGGRDRGMRRRSKELWRSGTCVISRGWISQPRGLVLTMVLKARREVEVSKLRAALDKKLDRMEKWANRLERKAGGSFKPSPDGIFLPLSLTSFPCLSYLRGSRCSPRPHRGHLFRAGRHPGPEPRIRQVERPRIRVARPTHPRPSAQRPRKYLRRNRKRAPSTPVPPLLCTHIMTHFWPLSIHAHHAKHATSASSLFATRVSIDGHRDGRRS
jgi:hypothetical protein